MSNIPQSVTALLEQAIDALIAASRKQTDDVRYTKVLDLVESILEFMRLTVLTKGGNVDTAVRMLAYSEDSIAAFIRRGKGMKSWKNVEGLKDLNTALDSLAEARRTIRTLNAPVVFEGGAK